VLRDLFSPSRLTQARHLARLSKADLARRVQVSAAAIGQYEAGLTVPSQGVLGQLAAVLDVPESFFAAGRPLASVDAGGVFFRSLRSTPARERDFSIAVARQVWELLAEIENFVEFPSLDLPELDESQVRSPIGAASVLREAWGLGHGPVKHLVRTAEARGVVFVMPSGRWRIDSRTDAYTAIDLPRPVSVLSPRDSDDVMRHRFSVAHELGHLVMHRGMSSGSVSLEREADQFAAEFLAPSAAFHALLPTRLDLARLADLGAEWGVSVKALVFRSKELRRISDDAARRAYIRLSEARSSGLLEARPISELPGEQPRLLLDAVNLVVDALGPGVLSARMKIPMAALRELVGDEPRPALRVVQD